MFKLQNIISFTNSNIQIIGIFIAIIGGLVATKLLNKKIEKDELSEKLNKINKEIDFNQERKLSKEEKIYNQKKKKYIDYIYEKIIETDFDMNNYENYELTEEQRLNIINEIKSIMKDALDFFHDNQKKSQVKDLLKKEHIQENTYKYDIYEFIGFKTGDNTNKSGIFGINPINMNDIRFKSPINSLDKNLSKRDLSNKINEIDELLKWKLVEKEDLESKIDAINKNLSVKNDVILFIIITIFSIIIPQIVLSVHPLFINFKWLKYLFAIYSLFSFIISMILMLLYIYNLFKNLKN